jgi:hypothetical protein
MPIGFETGKGTGAFTRHIQRLAIAPSPSTSAREIWPDKQALRDRINELRAEGLSFRRISAVIGLHWTRSTRPLKGRLSSEEVRDPRGLFVLRLMT